MKAAGAADGVAAQGRPAAGLLVRRPSHRRPPAGDQGAPAGGARRGAPPPADRPRRFSCHRGARGDGARPRRRPAADSTKTYDLANAYSIDGWFGDTFQDLIPDRLETAVSSATPASRWARRTLRRGSASSPRASRCRWRATRGVTNAAGEPNPILVGRSNDLVQQLMKLGKVRLDDLKPGEGADPDRPEGIRDTARRPSWLGADAAGTDAAAMYLARRVPYLWDVARGSFDLSDLTLQTTDFLAAKTGSAQASLALREVAEVLKSLDGKTIESFEAKAYLEEANPGFDTFLTGRIKETLNTRERSRCRARASPTR